MRQWLTNWLCDSIEFNPPLSPETVMAVLCLNADLLPLGCSAHSALAARVWRKQKTRASDNWGPQPRESSYPGHLTSSDAPLIGHRPRLAHTNQYPAYFSWSVNFDWPLYWLDCCLSFLGIKLMTSLRLCLLISSDQPLLSGRGPGLVCNSHKNASHQIESVQGHRGVKSNQISPFCPCPSGHLAARNITLLVINYLGNIR